MSILKVENLKHVYSPGTPFSKTALRDINLSIEEGEFVGLIGHTGSGKSTLLQHLNGLLKPTEGRVLVDGVDISSKDTVLFEIRRKVGLVFQYPEYQIFEETVGKDIAFGPSNLGLNQDEIENRVRESMELVGLPYEEFKDQSPFELSGGQKRRVAIAGVLAMDPRVLILDEPQAGLDPGGRKEILSNIYNVYEKKNITIILVSHSMEDIGKLAKRILVMDNGTIVMDSNVRNIFNREGELRELNLDVPQVTSLIKRLNERGLNLKESINVDEGFETIRDYLRGKKC